MQNLRADFDRYFFLARSDSNLQKIKQFLLTQGMWAILTYRIGSYVQKRTWTFALKKPLQLFATFLQKLTEILCGISIGFSTEIGRGLYIGHFGGIVIHDNVRIGSHCNISQGVTIGLGGRGDRIGVPVIGDRVYIGPNAIIIGKITIGNDVAIGANAVVTKSLPDNSVAVGIPAKVISFEGSKDFVVFRK